MNIQAVITGDIIRSTHIKEKEILISGIKEAFKEVNTKILGENASFELFRGDSFQILLPEPEKSLITAILIKSRLKSITPGSNFRYSKNNTGKTSILNKKFVPINLLWDARVSVGIGSVDYTTNYLPESQGKAFTLSGHGLDKLKKGMYTLLVNTIWPEVNDEFEASIKLADSIIQRWTSSSAGTFYYATLEGKTQRELVEILKVSQPAIHKRLARANEDAIMALTSRFEKVIKTHIS